MAVNWPQRKPASSAWLRRVAFCRSSLVSKWQLSPNSRPKPASLQRRADYRKAKSKGQSIPEESKRRPLELATLHRFQEAATSGENGGSEGAQSLGSAAFGPSSIEVEPRADRLDHPFLFYNLVELTAEEYVLDGIGLFPV